MQLASNSFSLKNNNKKYTQYLLSFGIELQSTLTVVKYGIDDGTFT
jgi:hypothetical protein